MKAFVSEKKERLEQISKDIHEFLKGTDLKYNADSYGEVFKHHEKELYALEFVNVSPYSDFILFAVPREDAETISEITDDWFEGNQEVK